MDFGRHNHTHADANSHVEPKELVFNGPFTSPVSQTIILPVTPSRDGYIDLRSTIGDQVVDVEDFFDVNSMRVTELNTSANNTPNEIPTSLDGSDGSSPHGYLGSRSLSNGQTNVPKTKQEITFTLKPTDGRSVSELPSDLIVSAFGGDSSSSGVFRLPIRYNPHGICGSCKVPIIGGRYRCQQCVPRYALCLDCVERFGRETHRSHIYKGGDHKFIYTTQGVFCSHCHSDMVNAKSYYQCLRCTQDDGPTSILCVNCAGNIDILLHHPRPKFGSHTFRRIEHQVRRLAEPVSNFHEHNQEVKCKKCHNKVRLNQEFFRCLDCTLPFHLCTRCADEGGIAEHIVHRFQFCISKVGV